MVAQQLTQWCLGFGVIFLAFIAGCEGNASSPRTEKVVIEGKSWELEIASDQAAIETGLSNRATIPDGTGMLFILPAPRIVGFWMKGCLTDIDIIFLDPNGRITATYRMKTEAPKIEAETDKQYEARLTSYSSRFPAQFAIELPPGSLDQLNVRFDDKIELDLERLKALAR